MRPGGPKGVCRRGGTTGRSPGPKELGYGNSWVVLALVVTPPFCRPLSPLAPPQILFALCLKGASADRPGCDLLDQVAEAIPTRTIHLVGVLRAPFHGRCRMGVQVGTVHIGAVPVTGAVPVGGLTLPRIDLVPAQPGRPTGAPGDSPVGGSPAPYLELSPDRTPRPTVRQPAGAHRAVRRVSAHLELLCDMLHHHHAGEDELLWPPLRALRSREGQARLDEAEAQHSDIDAALGMVNLARQRWTDVGGNGGRDDLIASLLLFGLLATHLDTEERELLPLAAAH